MLNYVLENPQSCLQLDSTFITSLLYIIVWLKTLQLHIFSNMKMSNIIFPIKKWKDEEQNINIAKSSLVLFIILIVLISVFLCWSKSNRCYFGSDCGTALHDCFLFDIYQLWLKCFPNEKQNIKIYKTNWISKPHTYYLAFGLVMNIFACKLLCAFYFLFHDLFFIL